MITLSLPRRIRKRPQPTFTPRAALRATTPLPAYAEAQTAWTAPPEFTTAPAALRAAVKALRGEGIAGPGANPYPEPHDDTVITEAIGVLPAEPPAPVVAAPRPKPAPRHRGRPSAGSALRADRDSLPVFRSVAREVGWSAAMPASPFAGWTRYTTGRWLSQSLAVLDRDVVMARAEHRAHDAEWDLRELAIRQRRQQAAESASAIGWPGVDL